ncbi:PH domain-containing protein [Saccharothrix australiensis]|uniref:PH domain-containing protein n=1 Tax=Saccharothrix australiensis TaxID=2072 RepID=UPI0014772190|nr:PH domain-containing protein [Saccharothrix australiensis]
MQKLVFRIPAPALIAAASIAICVTPFAWAAPGLQAIYLLPAGFAWWVLRNRTTVDPERLVARGTFAKRVVAWDEVKAIKVVPRGWLSAVLADDTQVRLPAVRAGHLPAIAAVSGGRVADPTDRSDAAPGETEQAGTEQAEPGPAQPVPAGSAPPQGEPTGAGPSDAGPSQAEPSEPEPSGADASEAGTARRADRPEARPEP